jgi:hypothetical protein
MPWTRPPSLSAKLLASVSRSVVELYAVALSLPPVKPDTNGKDEPSFPAAQPDELHRSLREKIGSIDTYWEVFDATKKQEPVQGSLAQDISEIYSDLKQSLWHEDTGTQNLICCLIGV